MTDVVFKSDTRRWLPLHLRDLLGINALEQLKMNEVKCGMEILMAVKQALLLADALTEERNEMINLMLGECHAEMLRILAVEVPFGFEVRRKLKVNFMPKRFEDFRYLENGEGIESLSGQFRFQSIEQLNRLKRGFPSRKIKIRSYSFDAD
jgi:hypothetical protein